MLRKSIGALLTLMLVATLVLPMASVGAQDATDESGQAPVVTEETIPESETPPVAEIPPVVETQPDAAVVDEPVIEEPVIEEPVVDAPAADEPVTDQPATDDSDTEVASTDETTDEAVEGADDEEEETPAIAAGAPVISGFTADCSGTVSFTIDEAGTAELSVMAWASGLPGHVDGTLDTATVDGTVAGPVSVTLNLGGLVGLGTSWIQFYLGSGGTGSSDLGLVTRDCSELFPEDPEPEPGDVSVLTDAWVDCEAALTFTITEAAGETLAIMFTNPNAPLVARDLGTVMFDATSTGTFAAAVTIPAGVHDVIYAEVYSPNAEDPIGAAAVYGCIDGDEWTSGEVDLTISCDGTVTYSAFGPGINWDIRLFDASTNPQTEIGVQGMSDSPGTAGSFQFDIPTGVYDSLVVRAKNYWSPLGIASVDGCLDFDPNAPVVENLSVTCNGLVTFDVETTEPAELRVEIFIPAAAPGYHDEATITAASGPQQVQFDLPVSSFSWAAAVSYGSTLLADITLLNCPSQPLNTLPGTNVTVPIAGGSVTFENVLEPGETYFNALDPASVPPIPAEFDGQLVIMIDLSTTAVISGAATVCLPIVGEVAADAENVRLLHLDNGVWVDITTAAGNGQVCGVTEHFSPFAIVWLNGDGPVDPGKPGKPTHPGKPGGPSGSGSNVSGLPNTGAGPQATQDIDQLALLLMAGLVLAGAAGLRLGTNRMRGADWR